MDKNSDAVWILKLWAVIIVLALSIPIVKSLTQTDNVTVPTQTTRAWTVGDSKAYAKLKVQDFADKEFKCLVKLWGKESSWSHKADNPKSSAYGIAQLLGEKSKDPKRQINQGLKYLAHRYDTICHALKHFEKRGWY